MVSGKSIEFVCIQLCLAQWEHLPTNTSKLDLVPIYVHLYKKKALVWKFIMDLLKSHAKKHSLLAYMHNYI